MDQKDEKDQKPEENFDLVQMPGNLLRLLKKISLGFESFIITPEYRTPLFRKNEGIKAPLKSGKMYYEGKVMSKEKYQGIIDYLKKKIELPDVNDEGQTFGYEKFQVDGEMINFIVTFYYTPRGDAVEVKVF